MKKNEILTNIRSARIEHIKWVERAKALVQGTYEIKEEHIPVEVTACNFSQWFYGSGQILLSILNEEIVTKLEEQHKELHYSYMKIFKIYFNVSGQSFFEKLLKKPKKITIEAKENAEEALEELQNISKSLIEHLNLIEQNINQLDDEDLKELY